MCIGDLLVEFLSNDAVGSTVLQVIMVAYHGCLLHDMIHCAAHPLSSQATIKPSSAANVRAQRVFCHVQEPEVRNQCHSLLFTRGLHCYSIHQFKEAEAVLKPALFFSPPSIYSRTARLLGASLMHLQLYSDALNYLDLADQRSEETSLAGTLLQLQCLLKHLGPLQEGPIEKVLAKLPSCNGISPQEAFKVSRYAHRLR